MRSSSTADARLIRRKESGSFILLASLEFHSSFPVFFSSLFLCFVLCGRRDYGSWKADNFPLLSERCSVAAGGGAPAPGLL